MYLGYLSHLITLIPGASQYFRGSIIAYSYELKTQLCGVLPNTLVEYGAVSEPTVIEMAKGIAKDSILIWQFQSVGSLDQMEARQKNQLELSGSQLAMKLM